MTVVSKDDKNLQQVLDKIAAMDEPRRGVLQRMHDVILAAAPELKPRIWYGMPGYATSASAPVVVFVRNDDLMSLGLSEKATLTPAGGRDGQLIPAAWFFDDLDGVTEERVAEIVRAAIE
ncbi:hypothetical protein AU196_14275 [Mycobacterium sp. IS-1742]|uniref:DUF1801 domain-containing protein n=1 Tax=Mycobacterium sp. IS-1742 TaxID=1772285 RepID=UPI00074045DC|nr:DUF1801 domain-containing protein [Mycobacterium sp. IS-1742]KUI30699.1 hypothetical protein AU196_14275 [Mycobacterium sp. IS-1742]